MDKIFLLVMVAFLAISVLAIHASAQVQNIDISINQGDNPQGLEGATVLPGTYAGGNFNIDFNGNDWCDPLNNGACPYYIILSTNSLFCPTPSMTGGSQWLTSADGYSGTSQLAPIPACNDTTNWQWNSNPAYMAAHPFCVLYDSHQADQGSSQGNNDCSSGTYCNIGFVTNASAPASNAIYGNPYGLCFWIDIPDSGPGPGPSQQCPVDTNSFCIYNSISLDPNTGVGNYNSLNPGPPPNQAHSPVYSISQFATPNPISGSSSALVLTLSPSPLAPEQLLGTSLYSPDNGNQGNLYVEYAPAGQQCLGPVSMPLCPHDPQGLPLPSTQQCIISNESGGIASPSASWGGSQLSVKVNVSKLTSGQQYNVCAYEGNPSCLTSFSGPCTTDQPWAFASQTFTVVCPPGSQLPDGTCDYKPPPPGATLSLSVVQSVACSVYAQANTLLMLLALTLMLFGAALYGGSYPLPGQMRAQARGYALGMLLSGLVGASLAVLTMWVLSVISGVPVTSILSLNGCA